MSILSWVWGASSASTPHASGSGLAINAPMHAIVERVLREIRPESLPRRPGRRRDQASWPPPPGRGRSLNTRHGQVYRCGVLAPAADLALAHPTPLVTGRRSPG
jgi:hypothetical protein